ncbi:MAG: hypothetical protein U9R06_00705 [Patescibacteria group bacterium]|nr:hypothetical protein [Patescibacteria group bacterium]
MDRIKKEKSLLLIKIKFKPIFFSGSLAVFKGLMGRAEGGGGCGDRTPSAWRAYFSLSFTRVSL